MSKHTPGPWKVGDEDSQECNLLEACKRMLRCHDEGWKKMDFHPIEDIRAAIAKAEPVSP